MMVESQQRGGDNRDSRAGRRGSIPRNLAAQRDIRRDTRGEVGSHYFSTSQPVASSNIKSVVMAGSTASHQKMLSSIILDKRLSFDGQEKVTCMPSTTMRGHCVISGSLYPTASHRNCRKLYSLETGVDCCNSLIVGTSNANLHMLQQTQNRSISKWRR